MRRARILGYDPSDTGISGVYVGAFHDYIQKELKYMSQEPYYLQGQGSIRTGTFIIGRRVRSPAVVVVDAAGSRRRRTWRWICRMRCGRTRI